MKSWFGRKRPYDLLRDPRRDLPEPTAAWTSLALGFTALIALAVAGASEPVLLLVAWAVASIATVAARHA
jgi:hypothetical protein